MAFKKKFDFASLDRLTAEEIEARSQRTQMELDAQKDERRFKGKPLREVDVMFTGDRRGGGMFDDTYLRVSNNRGDFNISIDYDRWKDPKMDDLMGGVNRALIAQEDAGEEAKLPMKATGVFSKRYWKDRDGKGHESWEFKATKISVVGYDENGQNKAYTAGMDIRQKPQALEVDKQKPKARDGDER